MNNTKFDVHLSELDDNNSLQHYRVKYGKSPYRSQASMAHSELYLDEVSDYLEHHGIKGQQWRKRKFSNYVSIQG
ncbi:MAG: hypothetical protein KBT27_03490 [Prevotellaceae bacterium]|nr:hypothetical protein [Candidatus Faecinaster equi]